MALSSSDVGLKAAVLAHILREVEGAFGIIFESGFGEIRIVLHQRDMVRVEIIEKGETKKIVPNGASG